MTSPPRALSVSQGNRERVPSGTVNDKGSLKEGAHVPDPSNNMETPSAGFEFNGPPWRAKGRSFSDRWDVLNCDSGDAQC